MITFSHLANNDVIYVICKFLEPKDIINLLYIYSRNNKNNKNNRIESCLKNRTAENLDRSFRKVFNDKYEEFKENMVKTGAIVSGSAILQVLFGEVWKTKFSKIDVDIFVPVFPIYDEKIPKDRKDKEYTFYNHKFKFKLGYTSLHRFMYKYMLSTQHNLQSWNIGTYETHSQYRDELGENIILRVNGYPLGKGLFTFELVEINREKIIKGDNWEKTFVNKHTDFNICKNYFQYGADGSLNIYFEDLKSIIYKKAKFNYVNDINKSLERCKKYVERGFMFGADERLEQSKAVRFFEYFLKSC